MFSPKSSPVSQIRILLEEDRYIAISGDIQTLYSNLPNRQLEFTAEMMNKDSKIVPPTPRPIDKIVEKYAAGKHNNENIFNELKSAFDAFKSQDRAFVIIHYRLPAHDIKKTNTEFPENCIQSLKAYARNGQFEEGKNYDFKTGKSKDSSPQSGVKKGSK